jgi:uncharacterized protein (TIGR03067 family)
MKGYAWSILAGIAVSLVAAADDGKQDLERMQGTWASVSYTVDGKAWGDADRTTLKLTIKGDESTIVIGTRTARRTYRIDAAKKPRALDIAVTDGDGKGTTKPAIYQFDGEHLMICIGAKSRPTDFSSKPGSGQTLEVWKRSGK